MSNSLREMMKRLPMNPAAPAVLVVGADPLTLGLLREWLAEAGWRVLDDPAPGTRCALVLVDVPFPRRGRSALLARVALEHAGTPVLALSATFHAGVERTGPVAQALGVDAVLPVPLRREALLEAVAELAEAPR